MSKRRGGTFSRNGADQGRRGANNSGWLDFGESPFGVGNSRLAYRCRVRDGCCYGYTEGSYLVFKVFKPEDEWSMVDQVSYTDVEMQRRVRLLAEAFNEEAEPTQYSEPCNIICRDAALGYFEVRGSGVGRRDRRPLNREDPDSVARAGRSDSPRPPRTPLSGRRGHLLSAGTRDPRGLRKVFLQLGVVLWRRPHLGGFQPLELVPHARDGACLRPAGPPGRRLAAPPWPRLLLPVDGPRNLQLVSRVWRE
jgi:hypothetical protein